MTRKVTSDSKIQEVFKYAGKKLLVIHFYDKERHCKGLRLKNSGGSFYLAEINKLEKELLEIERIESLIKLQNIRNAQLTDSEQRYILTIKAKIENNWLIPHNTKHDKMCTAIVNQLPSGKVTSVTIHGCKGDSIYIDSLVNAVWKSSPLPVAPDIEVFQENIVLQFEEPN